MNKFRIKVRVQLPDGTFEKLPIAVKVKNCPEEVVEFDTFDEALDWFLDVFPFNPDIDDK